MRAWMLVWLFAAAGVLAGCETMPTAPGPTREQVACGEAQIVIDALRRFRREHGRYPAELAALSPKYLPAESIWTKNQSLLGQTPSLLEYRDKSASEYELFFGLGLPQPQHYLAYLYSSRTGRWTSAEETTPILFLSQPAGQ